MDFKPGLKPILKPRLIAFDLDGTLAVSKTLVSADMGRLLSQLTHTMPFAVLSGASFTQFETQFLPAIPTDANFGVIYLFPMNASACFKYQEGTWQKIYEESFTPEERSTILQALGEAMKQTGFDTPPPLVWGERIEDRGSQITFSGLGQQAPVEEKKKWDPTKVKRKPLYEELVKRLPEFSIGLNAATSIDITRKGVTKAYGIKRLAALSGIPISDMLFVGDALEKGGNDSVVLESGIKTHQVSGPDETTVLIKDILQQ